MAEFFSDTDQGWEAMLARLKKGATPYEVSIGILDEDAEDPAEGNPDMTIGEIAEANEFGIGVPRRSFLVDWVDENESKIKGQLRKMARAIIEGEVDGPEEALDLLGLAWVGDIQKRIKAGIEPPNADSTVARKGSSTPLINTGQLWQSIRHKVEKV